MRSYLARFTRIALVAALVLAPYASASIVAKDKVVYGHDGYDQNGFDKNGYDRSGFDKNGFNSAGFDRNGFDKKGFDRDGYDHDGYDKKGFDRHGLNRKGQDANGHNGKVEICHHEAHESAHTITVSQNAVPAHLAHGDTLGACTVSAHH